MKVLMACPIFNYQDIKVRKNHELIREQSIHDVSYVEVFGASVEHAKSIMYKEFLKTGADYYFAVDADIAFLNFNEFNPIDLLIDLNENMDNVVVGGVYTIKRQPIRPAFRPLELQKAYEDMGIFPDNYKFNIPETPFQVQWLLGGCMMIKREIIEKLTKKYQVPNLPMIYKKEYLSEDFAFCQRAIQEGYSMWMEPKIEIGHQGTYFYTLKDYKH